MRTRKLDSQEIKLIRDILDNLVKNRGGKPEDYLIYYFINLKDEEKLVFRNKETLAVYIYKGIHKYHQRIYEKLPMEYVLVLTLQDPMIPKRAENLTEEVLKAFHILKLPTPAPNKENL